MYVDLLPKNSAQKFPALSEAVRIKQTVIEQTENQEDPWFIHLKIFWKKLRNKIKYLKKIHGESLDRGRDPIEKTISAIAAISNRWPREVIKIFVNVRFFSRLKKLNVIFKEKSKNNVRTLKQTAQFMFQNYGVVKKLDGLLVLKQNVKMCIRINIL